MYAIVVDGVVTEYPILNLNSRFPQTSFPAPMVDTALPEGVVRVLPSPTPAYDPSTHRVQEGAPELVKGQWYATYVVTPLGADELAAIYAGRAATVRSERSRLLQQSDWTQLADTPVNKAAWASYRQALRDVPAQAGFPHAVVWPQEP